MENDLSSMQLAIVRQAAEDTAFSLVGPDGRVKPEDAAIMSDIFSRLAYIRDQRYRAPLEEVFSVQNAAALVKKVADQKGPGIIDPTL